MKGEFLYKFIKKNILITLILILALVLRIFYLSSQRIHPDAFYYSLQIASSNILQLFKSTAQLYGGNPPLYYLILHYTLKIFGTNLFILRLLTAVTFSILSVYLTYLIAYNLFNKKTALVSSFFVAIHPVFIEYGQKLREHSLFIFLVLLSTFLLIKYMNNKDTKYLIWYSLANFSILFTHYPSMFLLMSHGIFLLLFERTLIKKWFLSQLIVFLLFAPWIFLLYQNLLNKTLARVPELGLQNIKSPIKYLDGIYYTLLPPFPFLILTKYPIPKIMFVVGKFSRHLLLLSLFVIIPFFKKKKNYILPFFLLFIPFICIYLLFIIAKINLTLSSRHISFAFPFFYIIIGSSIAILKKYIRILIILFIVLICVNPLLDYYNSKEKETFYDLVGYLSENKNTEDTILVHNSLKRQFNLYWDYNFDKVDIEKLNDIYFNHSYKADDSIEFFTDIKNLKNHINNISTDIWIVYPDLNNTQLEFEKLKNTFLLEEKSSYDGQYSPYLMRAPTKIFYLHQ